MSEVSMKRVRNATTMARNGTQNDGFLMLIGSMTLPAVISIAVY
jgi:hypothetical protein